MLSISTASIAGFGISLSHDPGSEAAVGILYPVQVQILCFDQGNLLHGWANHGETFRD